MVVQLSDRSEYTAGELDMILGTGAEPQLALPEINAIRANATVRHPKTTSNHPSGCHF